MRKHIACFSLVLAAILSGCKGGDTNEVEVPKVQEAEQAEIHTEGGSEAAPLETEAAPGTVLGEEEVVLMQEGEASTVLYQRVQGMEGFTIAYDPNTFTLEAGEKELRFDAVSYGRDSATPVFLRITETEGDSAEGLADQYVAKSNEECFTEEVTIGEGEYPAILVSYAEGTDGASRTCDIYVLRYNEKLYTVQMDCFTEAYERLGAVQESILSTLRFDEG